MIQEQLIKAFPVHIRNELTGALSSAYTTAALDAAQFGSFAGRAMGYSTHFWTDALLEKAAIRLKLDHHVAMNRARNTPHLVIRSGGWQLTPHRVSGPRSLPNRALYREHYSHMSDLFADSDDADVARLSSYGYVYLLHSGRKVLSNVSLTVPDREPGRVVHSENLELAPAVEASTEEISDQLTDSIRAKVEKALRDSG